MEAVERRRGAAGLALLTEGVPRRLLPHASLDRLTASAALDTILLDDGEELLLLIDSLLGDGSGRVLEWVGSELASRALNQGGVAKFGDFYGTVARLQAFLEHPFVDTPTLFELKRTDLGFTLTVGVAGRPRATRVLRHLAVGAVTAAERSAREGDGSAKLSSDLVADRATLTAHYQRAMRPPRADSEAPPTSVRRPTRSARPPSLSEEVERILGSSRAQPTSALPAQPADYPAERRSLTPAPPRSFTPPPETQRRSSYPALDPALDQRPSDVHALTRGDEFDGPPELKRVKG